MAKFPNFFQTYDEEEDTKTTFCMHNVSFALQTSDYSTVKLYRLTESKDIKQMFTAVLNNEGNQIIRFS